MKRPRWLGSGESKEEETGDGDSAADSATDEGEGSTATPTAAERSARRTARKALGARVAGDDPPSSAKKAKAEAKKKPEPVRVKKPTAEKKVAEEKKPAEAKKPTAAKPKAGKPTDSGDDEPKKLHRPRPQKDREPLSRKPGTRERGDTKPGKKGGEDADGKATERSRKRGKAAEPKRERKPLGPRVRGAAVASAGALKRGAVETRKQVAVSAPKAGRRMLAALAAVFAIFFGVLGFFLGVLIAVGLVVAKPIRWLLVRLRRWTDAASRIATPTRVLALVVAGAAILLALSQYADYRSISIGNDAYSGVQTVAPAPETGRLPTGDPNSYIFVPIGIVCLLLLGGALTGRWRLCRLIALAGVAAIVVAIVVDRPAGLDTGDTALAFEGVRANLLGGFYAQIAAGVLLVGSSSLLARELRLAGATERAKPERHKRSEKHRRAVPPPADTGGVRA